MSNLRNSYAKIANQPRQPRFLNLSLNNEGLVYNANGDYSVTEERFYFEVPADDLYVIQFFDMHIQAAANLKSADYGDINLGLTNGLDWFARIDGQEQIITPKPLIKSNEDLFRLGNAHNHVDYSASISTHSYASRLDNFSDGFLLSEGDQMGVILRDDHSTMLLHEFFLTAWSYGGISRP